MASSSASSKQAALSSMEQQSEEDWKELRVELDKTLGMHLRHKKCPGCPGKHDAGASCRGHLEKCFPCILTLPTQKDRAQFLRGLFKDVGFRRGPTEEWKEIQLRTLRQLSILLLRPVLMEDIRQASYDGFKNMLVGADIIPALLETMTLRTPDHGHPNRLWPSIVYYCITLLGALCSPQEAIEDKPSSAKKFIVKMANTVCQTDTAVRQLVSFMEGARDLVEVMAAMWTLRNLCVLSENACTQFVKHGGLKHTAELLVPGRFQKMCGEARDRGMRYYVKFVIAEMTMRDKDEFYPLSAMEMTDDGVFASLIDKTRKLHIQSASILFMTSVKNKENSVKLFEMPGVVTNLMRWLRRPNITVNILSSPHGHVIELLMVFSTHKPLALQLVNDHNLLDWLTRWIFVADAWPLDYCLELLVNLLRHGGCLMRRIVEHTDLVIAVGCHAFSTHHAVSAPALLIIAKVGRMHPSVVLDLHINDVLSRVTLVRYETLAACGSDLIYQRFQQVKNLCRKHLGEEWDDPDPQDYMPCCANLRNAEVQKLLGNEKFQNGDYCSAIDNYTSGLMIANYNTHGAVLYSNRSECYLREECYYEAARDATLALGCGYTASVVYIKTLFRRAKAFHMLDRPFEALADVAVCVQSDPSDDRFKVLYMNILKDFKEMEGAIYNLHECSECHLVSEGFRKCSGCSIYYCSKTCQLRAWPQHKLVCIKKNSKSKKSSCATCDSTANSEARKTPPPSPRKKSSSREVLTDVCNSKTVERADATKEDQTTTSIAGKKKRKNKTRKNSENVAGDAENLIKVMKSFDLR